MRTTFPRLKSSYRALLAIASSTSVALMTGCLRHTAAIQTGGYQFIDLQGITVLEPLSKSKGVTDQWVSYVTFAGVSQTKSLAAGDERCSVHTRLFSFVPGEAPDRWVVKSPSAPGWTLSSIQEQLASDWMHLIAGVTKLEQAGCFPAKETTYSVQRAIANAIPVPADQALLFYYSLTGSGYVDLQPGLEIRIEKASSSTGTAKLAKETFSLYEVVPRSGVGAELRLSASSKKAQRNAPYAELPKSFAPDPYLRLFLEQGATNTTKPREAILLGAQTSDVLDRMTATILSEGPAACRTLVPGSDCIVFSNSGVSLLSTITINGRSALHAPGTTLGQLIDALPDDAKKRALATVSVQRPVKSGYAELIFQRELDAASKVILINGDRISWTK